MPMKVTALAAAACALFAVAVPAQAQLSSSFNGRQVVTGFNFNEIVAAAVALGYQAQVINLSDGTPVVKFTTTDAIFFGQRTVCNTETCSGLFLYTSYKPGFDIPLTTINGYNKKQSIISIHQGDDVTFLTRYLIADFGDFIGNIASNLHNFNGRAKEFVAYVNGASASVSAKVEMDEAAADRPMKVEAAFAVDEAFHLQMKALAETGGAVSPQQ